MGNTIVKDLAVVGGGIGGYSAAIRASQLGKSVVLINDGPLGGTCLNVGCIPTKALLHSAELFESIKGASKHGVNVGENISFDYQKILDRKNQVVNMLVSGVKRLVESNDIEYVNGKASFIDSNTLIVGDIEFKAENIIIATGSVPSMPPIQGIELDGVMDSTAALSMDKMPKSIVIIGGGVIGLEFAQIFSSFDVKTTIIEMLPNIGGKVDSDIAFVVKDTFSKRGVDIKVDSAVKRIEKSEDGLRVVFTSNGEESEVLAEKVLVSTGRKAYTEGLGFEKIGLELNKGKIPVDSKMQTKIASIYAVGDVCSDIMLAHVAEEQGIIAAEQASGLNPESFDYKIVPSCIYTDPEIAFVGMTEDEAKKSGVKYRVGVFELTGNGKTIIEDRTKNTFVKLIFDDVYDEMIGAHIYGPSATELIAEMALAIKLEATAEEIIQTIHAHPTVGESIKEAALASFNRAIHSVKKRN